jgi:hypothetical protein
MIFAHRGSGLVVQVCHEHGGGLYIKDAVGAGFHLL